MTPLSLADQSRRGELDQVVDPAEVQPGTPGEVFAISDAVRGVSALRRSLSDPALDADAKQAAVRDLFGAQVGEQALSVAERAVALRWPGTNALLAALERQGVRLALCVALDRGALERVSAELHEFTELVGGNDALQAALANERTPLAGRRKLVASLLEGKADPVTIQLAERALVWNDRSFAQAVESMLVTAADLRGRTLATIVVARPLDAEQEQRLRAVLEKQAGRPVELQIDVDPAVVGGARVSLGDDIFEGTVQNMLTQLERSFG